MMKNKILGAILIGIAMLAAACSNADEYVSQIGEGPAATVLLSEAFADTIGKFTTASVSGEQVWAVDKSRGYAYISGYVDINKNNRPDAGEYFENEDWLISPEIDLTSVKAAHFSFEHVARYFTNPMDDATVWLSENYSKDQPSTAQWTQIQVAPFSDPGSYTFGSSGQISLTPYAGKKIKIAFKYTSAAANAGTWEIKNFVVASGEAYNKNNGKGTKDAPYTVEGAMTAPAGMAWVQGYIVGYWSGNTASFTAKDCNVKTNILLCETKENVYLSKCMYVDLSKATVQSGLNLVDHPDWIGHTVTVYGTIGKNSGLSALNAASYYMLDNGASGGDLPPILYESFTKNLGDFTTQNVSGDEVWIWTSGYAKMTGYVNSANKANEDWLISPKIDLSGISTAKLTFDYVTRYFNNPAADCTVWIASDYKSGLPSTATWTQLTPPTAFTNGSNWNFLSSGVIDLSAYSGKNVNIAFKYLSTDVRAGTWEIKNVMVNR